MRLRLLLTVVLMLLLGACHSVKLPLPTTLLPQSPPPKTLADAKKQLDQATPCCTSFADFSYQDRLPWRPQQFVLGNGSPVAAINGVRSYFLSFVLPVDAKLPYKVALKSELIGRSVMGSSYLFAPSVVQLDDAFQPIDSQDVKLCEYMGWSNSDSGAFGSVIITDKRARYLVVYSSGKQQSDNTYWEQSASTFTTTGSGNTPAAVSTGGSYKIQHGPDGTVWVGMMDKPYAEAVNRAVCGKAPQGDGLLHSLRTDLPAHLSWSSL
ncbi:MalM family protein [Dyella lipolytica]|uniref:Maltose operon substrate-binding protein (MalM) n=1 Tax=Dyella lipolytica TaxID=1867835 RepID=A0ABW8ISJ2_9GAMM|nr:MalM family protein [Dyella lipolytica]